MSIEVAKIVWFPIAVAGRAIGGILSGAGRGLASKAPPEPGSVVSLHGPEDIFSYLQHHTQNIIGGGLDEIGKADLLSKVKGFISELLSREGFKNAFIEGGTFAKLTGAITENLTLKGGAVLGAYGALAIGAIMLGKKLFSSENEQTDLASRGWSTDFIKSEDFHKLRMAMGGLLAGGGILSIAVPSIGVPLALIGAGGALASHVYRELTAGLNPINHPDFGSWWNRWFFKLFNSYSRTSGY